MKSEEKGTTESIIKTISAMSEVSYSAFSLHLTCALLT